MEHLLPERSKIVGVRFASLTVIELAQRRRFPASTKLIWRCKCDCGGYRLVETSKLKSGRAKKCLECRFEGGCRTEWSGYSSLKSAKARCGNPKHKAYKDYGGRGISVCARWKFGEGGKTGFECFYDDMGPCPRGKSLDRINVDGNYTPDNCRWATKKQQQQNQRRAIYADIGGVPVPLKKYVHRTGLCYETIRSLVRRKGISVKDAARGVIARAAA